MKRRLYIILAILGLLVYLNSLGGVLFWDDEVTVINNVFIRNPVGYFGKIFSTSYHSGGGENLNFYRPLATLSLALNFFFCGLNPFGYHLLNLLLHILSGIFVLLLLQRIFGDRTLSFLAACLFLVHPINSEAVNYVSNRTDLLMLFFFLAALYFYVIYRQKKRPVFLSVSVAMYLFSILSKEMGLVLPLFLSAYDMLFTPLETGRGKAKSVTAFTRVRRFAPLSGFLAVFAIYAALRATRLNFLNINLLTQGAQPVPYSGDIIFRLLVFAKSCLTYLRLFFWPVNLHMEYDLPYIGSTADFAAWARLLCLLFSTAVLFYLGRRKKTVIFGGLWVIFGLLPVSGIIPINSAVSEHYVYLSSIGFFILIAALIPDLWRKSPFSLKAVMAGAGMVILVSLCFLTSMRNRDWHDPLKMYLDIAGKTKYSFRANNNAGVEYFRKGDFGEAERYFRRSLEISPDYSQALNNLGVILQRQGRLKEAEEYYKKSIASNFDYILAHKNLSEIYLKTGRVEEAKGELSAILRIYPYDSESHRLSEYLNSIKE